jgi:transcriptional regulatory protein LevR
MAACIVQFVQKQLLNRPMVILFDSGSTKTWISAKAMPKGAVWTVGKATTSSTLTGKMNLNLTVNLERIVFPEFFSVEAKVYHAELLFRCYHWT